jgi:hypothetical protein
MLSGRISNKINQVYVVKTSLGETYFTSDIKILENEKLTLNIEQQVSDESQKLKFVSDILRTIMPNSENISDVSGLLKNSIFKQLSETMNNIGSKNANLLISKMIFPKDNMLSEIYNLYKAVTDKDITKWLGADVMKEIVADTTTAQKNISEITQMLQNFLKDNVSWKIVEIPFYDGSQFFALKIAVKKDKQQKENKKDSKTTRFIVETEFSKLGKFQFDGFCKSEKRNLDLIIRTSKKISDDFCSNIINLFKKSLYDLNYSGTLKIDLDDNFVRFDEEEVTNEGIYI